MESLIILLIIGLIIYLVNQLSPSTKFTKAKKKLDSGNFIEASEIFESIFQKHPDAPAKLAECKFQLGIVEMRKDTERAQRFFLEIIELKKNLSIKSNKKLFELVEARANLEIITCKFNSILTNKNEEFQELEIQNNLKSIDSVIKSGIEENFTNLKIKHLKALVECLFSLGKKNEKSNKLDLSIKQYQKAKEYADSIALNSIKYDLAARIGIITLKSKKQVDKTQIKEIDKSNNAYKNDFYFRYAKWLIVQKDYNEAEEVVLNRITISSPHLEKLKTLIRSVRTKIAIEHLERINDFIDQIYDNTFQINELKQEYEKLDTKIEEILIIVPSLSERLQKLKPCFFNRIMMNYIETEDYSDAVEFIHRFPTFYKDHGLLKNLGICCYGLTFKEGLTRKNFKTIISSWLTAVFSDNVILKSLEETSWDNEYTFTLLGAIGSKFNQHNNLPENVNYDEPTETNICIGDTQAELLNQFEILLQHRISDKNNSEIVHSFYANEKASIEKIVSIIENDILLPAPHFAKTFNLSSIVIDELDEKFYETGDEEILQAGLPYFSGELDSKVGEYHSAQELISMIKSSIGDKDLVKLKSITKQENKHLITEFSTINEQLEGMIFNSFSTLIDQDDQDEELIEIMEECIRFIDKNDKLKFQYSNYVSNYSVQKVNEGDIDNYEALSLMKRAYMNSDSNPRICKNFITIISNNLMDILNNSTEDSRKIYSILDEIYFQRSEVFMQSAVELSKTRSEILERLKRSGVSIHLLTDETRFPFISSSTVSLTPDGEKMKKVLAYMKKLSTRGFGELDDMSETIQKILRSRV